MEFPAPAARRQVLTDPETTSARHVPRPARGTRVFSGQARARAPPRRQGRAAPAWHDAGGSPGAPAGAGPSPRCLRRGRHRTAAPSPRIPGRGNTRRVAGESESIRKIVASSWSDQSDLPFRASRTSRMTRGDCAATFTRVSSGKFGSPPNCDSRTTRNCAWTAGIQEIRDTGRRGRGPPGARGAEPDGKGDDDKGDEHAHCTHGQLPSLRRARHRPIRGLLRSGRKCSTPGSASREVYRSIDRLT